VIISYCVYKSTKPRELFCIIQGVPKGEYFLCGHGDRAYVFSISAMERQHVMVEVSPVPTRSLSG
jgi:hypothetical protein